MELLLLMAGTGLSVLGSYTSGKAAQQAHKAKAQELKIQNEIDFINSVAQENSIISQLSINQAENLASTSGGESAMAFIEDQDTTTAKDIKRLTTSTILNRESKKRSIKSQFQAGKMAKRGSLLEIGTTLAQGGIEYGRGTKGGSQPYSSS